MAFIAAHSRRDRHFGSLVLLYRAPPEKARDLCKIAVPLLVICAAAILAHNEAAHMKTTHIGQPLRRTGFPETRLERCTCSFLIF